MFSIRRDKLRQQWQNRGGFKDPNSQRGMEIRHTQKKMDYYVYITILYIFIMETKLSKPVL